MKIITLQSMYEDFIKSQLDGQFEGECGYRIWSYLQTTIQQTIDWKGNPGTPVKLTHRIFIRLGKRGLIEIFGNGHKKDQLKLISDMKKWVWKKYFQIDL